MKYGIDELPRLRATILGNIQWKQCLSCNGSGFENWNEYGEDIRPGRTSDPDRCEDTCENCEGLGFVVATQTEEA